jgi:HD-GYP domain-containing protein (c-di-GMP phosphodiesterase class II)
LQEILGKILNIAVSVYEQSINLELQHYGQWKECQAEWEKLLGIIESVKNHCITEYMGIRTRVNGLYARDLNGGGSNAALLDGAIRSTIHEIQTFLTLPPQPELHHVDEEREAIIRQDYEVFLIQNYLHLIHTLLAKKNTESTKEALQIFESLYTGFVGTEYTVSPDTVQLFEEDILILEYRFCRIILESREIVPNEVVIVSSPKIADVMERIKSMQVARFEDNTPHGHMAQIDARIDTLDMLEADVMRNQANMSTADNVQVSLELFKAFTRFRNYKLELHLGKLGLFSEDERGLYDEQGEETQSSVSHKQFMLSLLETERNFEDFEDIIKKNHNLLDRAHLYFSKTFFYKVIYNIPHRRVLMKIHEMNPRLAIGLWLSGRATSPDDGEEFENLLKHMQFETDGSENIENVPEKYRELCQESIGFDPQTTECLVDILDIPYMRINSCYAKALAQLERLQDQGLSSYVQRSMKRFLIESYLQALGDIEGMGFAKESSRRRTSNLTPSILLVRKPLATIPFPHGNSFQLHEAMYDLDAAKAIELEENLILRQVFREVLTQEIDNIDIIVKWKPDQYGNLMPVCEADWDKIFLQLKTILPTDYISVIDKTRFSQVSAENPGEIIQEYVEDVYNPPTLSEDEIATLRTGGCVTKSSPVHLQEGLGATKRAFNQFTFYPVFTHYEDTVGENENEAQPYILVFVSHKPLEDELHRLEKGIDVVRFVIRTIEEYLEAVNRGFELENMHEHLGVSATREVMRMTLGDIQERMISIPGTPGKYDKPSAVHLGFERAKIDSRRRRREVFAHFQAVFDPHTAQHVMEVSMLSERIVDLLQVQEPQLVDHLLSASEDDRTRYTAMIEAFMQAGHSQVAADAVAFLNQLRSDIYVTPRDKELFLTAIALHDIGKSEIPDYILRNPGVLVPDEREVMAWHARASAEIATAIGGSDDREGELVGKIVGAHHAPSRHVESEKFVSAFRQLGGENVLIVLLTTAIDVFEALTAERPYRAPESLARLKEIYNGNPVISPSLKRVFLKYAEFFYGLRKSIRLQAIMLSLLQEVAESSCARHPFLQVELPRGGLNLPALFREHGPKMEHDNVYGDLYNSYEKRIGKLYPGDLDTEFENFLKLRIMFELLDKIAVEQSAEETESNDTIQWKLYREHDPDIRLLSEMIDEFDSMTSIDFDSSDKHPGYNNDMVHQFFRRNRTHLLEKKEIIYKRLTELLHPHLLSLSSELVKMHYPQFFRDVEDVA